jgi:prevent-host-death family protein
MAILEFPFMKQLSATTFKAKCLAMIDDVRRTGEPVEITRHGKPVARIVPCTRDVEGFVNPLKGSILFEKDLVAPTGERWNAEQ